MPFSVHSRLFSLQTYWKFKGNNCNVFNWGQALNFLFVKPFWDPFGLCTWSTCDIKIAQQFALYTIQTIYVIIVFRRWILFQVHFIKNSICKGVLSQLAGCMKRNQVCGDFHWQLATFDSLMRVILKLLRFSIPTQSIFCLNNLSTTLLESL